MIIYGVYKNMDMNEGRGPILLDKLFLKRHKAVTYMDNQYGVMGRHFSTFVNPKTGESYKSWTEFGMGDWELRKLEVIE